MNKLNQKMLKSFFVIALMFVSATTADASIINVNSISNNESNPASIFLRAGTYDVTPIGTSAGGAYNAWNAWNWGQVYGCDGSGANCTVGWINNYYFSSSEIGEIFLSDSVRYANSFLALANAIGTSFTLTTDAIVDFYIRDGINGSLAWDNRGGMSLDITSPVSEPVPEPSTMILSGAALLWLLYWKKRERHCDVA